jgi:hypothetical protein
MGVIIATVASDFSLHKQRDEETIRAKLNEYCDSCKKTPLVPTYEYYYAKHKLWIMLCKLIAPSMWLISS